MDIIGINAEMDALLAEVGAFEQQCVTRVKQATMITLRALFANTPVWSGESVAAYGIGLNGPGAGAPGYSGGPPGPTNSMRPMGNEPNRAGAEARAVSTVQATLAGMTKLADVHFGNGIDGAKWNLIDAGFAPNPKAARNKAGVQKPAEQLAKAQLAGDFS